MICRRVCKCEPLLRFNPLNLAKIVCFAKWFKGAKCVSADFLSKTVNKPNEPSRKSNRLKQEKFHVPWATLNYYLGRLMWCNVCVIYVVNLLSKTTLLAMEFNLPYAIADQASLLCENFVPTLISPTLYGLLYSVVMFLYQKTKETGIHNPKMRRYREKKEVVEVHDEVKLSKGEVRPAN